MSRSMRPSAAAARTARTVSYTHLDVYKRQVESGATEFGARKLTLSDAGIRFRDNGVLWWSGLNLFQKLKVMLLG